MLTTTGQQVDEANIKNKEVRVSTLTNDRHMIYDYIIDQDGAEAWSFPLYVYVAKNEKGETVIQFEPVLFYADLESAITPPGDDKIIVTYLPAAEIVEARDKFIRDFRVQVRRSNVKPAKMQASMTSSKSEH